MEPVLRGLAGDSGKTSRAAGGAAARPNPDSVTPHPNPSLTPSAHRVLSVSNWLATRLLPSPAWQPEQAWLKLDLPVPQMAPEAQATISSIVTVRTLSMQVLGLDPFQPGTATALARVVVTLNARLPVLAARLARPAPNKPAGVAHAAWSTLATVAESAARVQQAVSAGLFSLPPAQHQAYLAPGGLPAAEWSGFLARITALLPLIAAATALGAELSQPAALAEAMRVVKSLSVPPLANPLLVAQLTSALGAQKRIGTALGADPLAMPFHEAERQVMAHAQQAADSIPAGAQPPRIAQNPAHLAPPAAVAAAQSAPVAALAALSWRVPSPTALPALSSLLPALAFVKSLPPGVTVQKRPCAEGCDAAALMRAAGA